MANLLLDDKVLAALIAFVTAFLTGILVSATAYWVQKIKAAPRVQT